MAEGAEHRDADRAGRARTEAECQTGRSREVWRGRCEEWTKNHSAREACGWAAAEVAQEGH